MTRGGIVLGLVTMTFVQVGAAELLPSLSDGQGDPQGARSALALQTVLTTFIAAFAGGWVARRRFLLPSLSLWLVLGAASIYLLESVAAPTGQSVWRSALQYSAVAIALSGAATALGAMLGQRVAVGRFGPIAAET